MEDKALNNKPACLFSVSSLGLGHATRSSAVIRSYLKTHTVHLVSAGKALLYLREEFKGEDIFFYECKDYPPIERGGGTLFLFYMYLVIDSLKTMRVIKQEHVFIKTLCEKIKPEFIISDGRYGSHIPSIPSFLICHQVSFIMPKGLDVFQSIADNFNFKVFKKFNALLIPDYSDFLNNLAGKLAHTSMLQRLNHHYVGVLSSLKKVPCEKDIHYLFTISGYLEEHKEVFISRLIQDAQKLEGKKVFILGDTKAPFEKKVMENNIEIYSSVSGQSRQDLYNRSRYVISRSGYTTIMDLVELGIPGFLVPTPGQTEQEYLGEYLGSKKYFLVSNNKFDPGLLENVKNTALFIPPWTTETSVEKIHQIVKTYTFPKS